MTIEIKASGAVTPVSSGGSLPPRILRLNLAHINALRGTRPAILAQDRPQEIRKIAIVDDEAMIAWLLTRSLRRNLLSLGANIQEALFTGEIPMVEDGNTLILSTNISELSDIERRAEILKVPEVLVAQNVDILFTDFNMPGLTGEQIVRAIREQGSRGIIVGLTGQPHENTEPFYAAGADLVLEKPFNIKDILNLFN
ncbi:response regulator [Candidatus Saganbacteria bacterium]|nr:response regulator [Candidatus Saganbacteria bacterium]